MKANRKFISTLSTKMGNTVSFSKNGTMVSPLDLPNGVLTPKQMVVTERFTLAASFSARLKGVLGVGYRNVMKDSKLQPFSVKMFFKPGVLTPAPTVGINYENLRLSKGSLTDFFNPHFALVARKLTFSWEDNSSFMDCNANDEVLMTIIYPEIDKIEIIRGVHRSAGKIETTFSTFNKAKVAHCYLFLASAETEDVSETIYFKIPDISI